MDMAMATWQSLETLSVWHRLAKSQDAGGLDALLADDVVFHSPIVHTPQVGKPITTLYLSAAFNVFNTRVYGGPNTRPTSANVGVVDTASQVNFPRTLQLGVRFQF